MKVKDLKSWKAIHFADRTIIQADLQYMSAEQKKYLGEIEVRNDLAPGHYKALLKKLHT